ncbi:MAG TPA: phosphatase PAP2 family protein [Candidatus Solibacter sp.]|jgi:hypothetical protein
MNATITGVKATPTAFKFKPANVMRALAFGTMGIILLIPVMVAVRGGFYGSFVDSPLSGWGGWGTFVIHMFTRPSRKEVGITALLALAMRLSYDVAVGEKGYEGYIVLGMATFLGIASLIVLAVQMVRIKTERRVIIRRTLGVIALLNYMSACLGFYFTMITAMLPRKLDYFLYAFDGSLGFQPAFALGKFVSWYPPLYWVAAMTYNSIGFWYGLLYALHSRAHQQYRFNMVRQFVVSPLIGCALYFLFPATGPKYAFPTFPSLPAVVHAGAVLLSGRPNAMPSLHFGGAILLFWMSRPWKWMRILTGIICVFMAVATMSSGEHYFIDLVVALPYALVILALASDIREKVAPLAAGGAMVLAWLVALRYGTFAPALSWTLVIVTIVVSFELERRFARILWRKAPAAAAREDSSSSVIVAETVR